jgi:5-methylcytosine-specific restriction endonuclease McrA
MARYKIGDSVAREAKRVADANLRTEELGLKSTLTVDDWLKTIARYKNTCAYCGRVANCLEHIKPVKLGGGTTKKNCVPACFSCNKAKGNYQTGWVPRMQYVDEVKIYALQKNQFFLRGGVLGELGEEANRFINLAIKNKCVNGFSNGLLVRLKSLSFEDRWESLLYDFLPYSEEFPQGLGLDDICDFPKLAESFHQTPSMDVFLVAVSIPDVTYLTATAVSGV